MLVARCCLWKSFISVVFFSQSFNPVLKISIYLIYIIFFDGIWNVLFFNDVQKTCSVNITVNESFNLFMHNAEKWPSTLYSAHIARFLKYVWPCFNIMHQMLKAELSPSKKSLFYLLQWKPFKNGEKSFLFNLKSSFRSQDI